jgi:glycosyltransferase involved in cell wall biosynthesis
MRVAVFTDNDFNETSGVTTTLTAVLDHAPDGVQPRIYTAAALGADQPDYFAVKSVGLPVPFNRETRVYLPRWRRYLERVRSDRVDLLHLTTPGPLGLTALWIARQTGLPLIGSLHSALGAASASSSDAQRLRGWLAEYLCWMYDRCSQVLVPSAATRDALVECGLTTARLTLWPRGVDTDLFTPAKRSPALRRQWRADDDHPVVLYVGRLSREKGLDLFPSMLERLRTVGVRCRLVVAGDGPLRGPLLEQCPEAICTGPLGRERVAETFASADVFVFPSRTDTAGNVVLEAQASGLPVLVSGVGGPRESVVSGVTGAVCQGVDARCWAHAVAGLLNHADARQSMAAAARRYALSRRWELTLQPLFETYRRVYQSPNRAAGVRPAA